VNIIEHYERRKREVEEDIHFAETQPGFRVGQKTLDGEKDVTEFYKERLCAARDAYAQVIDTLKAKAEVTSKLRPVPTSIK
jgi:hypothetical protein